MIANLYMTGENRDRAFELWKSVKKHALKAKEGVENERDLLQGE